MLEKNQEKLKSQTRSLKIWAIYLTIIVIIGGAVLTGIFFDKVLKGTPGGGLEVSPKKVEALKSFLGTELMELNEVIKKQLDISTNQGALINSVIEGSPADNAGMQRGDVIMQFDRKRVRDATHLQELIADTSPGDRIRIAVERNQSAKVFYVKLEEAPVSTYPVSLTQGQPQGGQTLPQTQQQGQTPSQPGWGMSVAPIDPDMGQKYGLAQGQKGILVTGIIPGGASAAGIQVGDIIIATNNQPTEELSEFYKSIAGGQSAVLDIFRTGQTSYVLVQADPLQPPMASLGITTVLTAGNPNESDDEGYKGMPPVIPPKGEYDAETMGPRTTAGTQNRVEVCICPLCGTTVSHPPGIPCYEMECPVCGSRLINASPGIATAFDDTRTPNQGDPQRPSYAGAAKGQRDLNPISLSGSVQTGGGSDDEEDDKGQKPSSIPPMGNPGDAANVINIYQVGGQPTSSQPSDIPSMGRQTGGGQTTGAQTTAGSVNRVETCICPVCGTTVGHPAGIPCSELDCPYCGSRLIPASPGANPSTSQQGNMPSSTGQGMAQGGGETGANSSTSQQGNRPPSTGQGMAQGSAGSSMYGSSGSGGPAGECVCPVCATIVPHTASVPCYEIRCPKCGTSMVRAIPGVTVNIQQTDFLQIAAQLVYITAIELKSKIDNGQPFILLDLRSENKYNEGHIPGAISMPINEIPDRYVELSPNQEIILYCQVVKSAQDAVEMLVKLGFANVKILTGGISAWNYGLVITPMGYTTSDKPETIPPTDKGQSMMTTAGNITQKIAISSEGKNLSSKVAPLFDRSPYFIIVGLGVFQAYKNPNTNDSKDVGIQSAQFVVDKGAGAVITNNISLEAMKELHRLNVKVYSGVSGTVSQAIECYMEGHLNETTVGIDKSGSDSHDEGEGKSKEKKGRDAEKANVVL